MNVQKLYDELGVLIGRGLGDLPVSMEVHEYNDEGYCTHEGTPVVRLSGTPARPQVILGEPKPDPEY